MNSLHRTYTGNWFKNRARLNWRVPIVCDAVMDVYRPSSLIDVGCAIAEFVNEFLKRGVDAYGIEGSTAAIEYIVAPLERIFIADLRKPFEAERYDLAMCLEVIEHIEPEYEEILLLNLVELSDRLMLSIAGPEQRGTGHVNLKPMEYWEERFDQLGYDRNVIKEERIRARWTKSRDIKGIKAYYYNLCCFDRRRHAGYHDDGHATAGDH